jgi:hypothetical protein
MTQPDLAPELGDAGRCISGLPAVDYHALRALSASGAWLLAEECPAKFLWRSPWNPLYMPEAKTEFDLGVAAHLAVLEPQHQADSVVLIEAGDYRSSRARDARVPRAPRARCRCCPISSTSSARSPARSGRTRSPPRPLRAATPK